MRSRIRPLATLASAGLTFAVLVLSGAIWSPPSSAQTDPWDGSKFTNPTDNATVSDDPVVFAGEFHNATGTPISSIDLDVGFQGAGGPGCPEPSAQTFTPPPPTTEPSPPDPTDLGPPPTDPSGRTTPFSFNVTFTCNGIYNGKATAHVDSAAFDHSIDVLAVKVAIPPPPPASFLATDNGHQTVTLTWAPPTQYAGSGPPPDFAGYRVSRSDAGGATFSPIGNTKPDVLSFTDTTIPAGGGSYYYEIESVRTFASSPPVVTGSALHVAGASTGAAGGSVGGAPATTGGSGSTGDPHFDEPTTLAEDEPGAGDDGPLAALPGGGTIQRFAGRQGEGLVKPFAAALDLGVWAGLLLFLTRRAARAEREHIAVLDVQHSP